MEREKKMRERWCLVMCKQQTKSKITETQIPLLVETQCFSGIVAALDLLDKNAPYSWLTVHTVCTTGSCTERNKCCWISGWWCSPSARNLSFWNVFNPLLSHRIDFWLFALLSRQLVAYSGPSVQCVLLLLNKASPDSPHRKTGPCLCQGRNTGEYGCVAARAVLVPLLVPSFSVTGCFSRAVPYVNQWGGYVVSFFEYCVLLEKATKILLIWL